MYTRSHKCHIMRKVKSSRWAAVLVAQSWYWLFRVRRIRGNSCKLKTKYIPNEIILLTNSWTKTKNGKFVKRETIAYYNTLNINRLFGKCFLTECLFCYPETCQPNLVKNTVSTTFPNIVIYWRHHL